MSAAVARLRGLPIWSALGARDFRLLWASEGVSVVGDQFHYVALAWLIISMTGSGLALGTVLIAAGVPRALLLVPFGVLADRRPPRSLMLAAHLGRGVIVGVVAGLAATGQATLPVLAALGALFGAVDALYLPAQQAFLPRAVSQDRLPSANALLQGTLQLASIVGPPLAGVVIALVGTGSAFAIDAISFVAAAGFVMLMATGAVVQAGASHPAAEGAPAAPATAPGGPGESFGESLRAGFRYLAGDPAIRMLLALSFLLNFAVNGPGAVGMAWLAQRRFDVGPVGLGLMGAGWAVGALIGTAVAGSVRLDRQGYVVVAAVLVSGVALAAVGLLAWFPGVLAALFVMGLAIGYLNVIGVSWLQARVEVAMLGRVMSLVLVAGFGITPLSTAIAGALIDVNATALFVGSGLLVVATGLAALALRFPAVVDGSPRSIGAEEAPAELPLAG